MSGNKRLQRETFSGTLRIGDISKITGIKVVTLRFYEAKGLLPKAVPKGRHRRYSKRVLHRLEFITMARSVGLSIPEVRGLILVLRGIKPPAAKFMRRLRETSREVDSKISHLQTLRRLLRKALEDPSEPLV
jgi:DNA-binding transcriptional MerR regulator